MTVDGTFDPAFAGVRDVFAAQLADGSDLGAAVTVHVGGRTVVDLWGGLADARAQRPWQADTAVVVFSATKAMTAVAALQLVARGRLDLDAPVAGVWPEFAAHGKDAVTLRQLLSHQAGLPAFDRPVSPDEAADGEEMAALLAAQRPEWTPGTAHGYHAITFGWLVGEVVRRVTGRPVDQVFRDEFGLQLGIAPDDPRDVAKIAAARDQDESAAADVMPVDAIGPYFAALRDRTSPMSRSTANPPASFNDPVVRAGGWPAAGLIASARELCEFYRQLRDSELLDAATLAEATREQVRGPDRTMITETAFGLGFMLPSQTMSLPPAAAPAYGHPGASGALGVADPAAGIAFGYVPNLMRLTVLDRRAHHLLEAVYDAL